MQEKLQTIWKARTVAEQPFRLLYTTPREAYKPDFAHRHLKVYGKRVDETLPPYEHQNFQSYENNEWVTRPYDTWTYYTATIDGEQVTGRLVDASKPPWEAGNFCVEFLDRKEIRDYNELPKDSVQRVKPLKPVKTYSVRFKAPVTIPQKDGTARTYDAAKLETTSGLFKALDAKLASMQEVGIDPRHLWLTISYHDGSAPADRYTVKATKLTEEEVQALDLPSDAPAGAHLAPETPRGEQPADPAREFLDTADDLNIADIPF